MIASNRTLKAHTVVLKHIYNGATCQESCRALLPEGAFDKTGPKNIQK